jgi:hypothetical protein
MPKTGRPTVSPIVCMPWCIYDDGHADAVFAEDQNCTGESHITPALA